MQTYLVTTSQIFGNTLVSVIKAVTAAEAVKQHVRELDKGETGIDESEVAITDVKDITDAEEYHLLVVGG